MNQTTQKKTKISIKAQWQSKHKTYKRREIRTNLLLANWERLKKDKTKLFGSAPWSWRRKRLLFYTSTILTTYGRVLYFFFRFYFTFQSRKGKHLLSRFALLTYYISPLFSLSVAFKRRNFLILPLQLMFWSHKITLFDIEEFKENYTEVILLISPSNMYYRFRNSKQKGDSEITHKQSQRLLN